MASKTQLLSSQDFLIIAHRGASSYAPENTIAAFDLALQMGASHLELDVHLTRDDSLVTIHDDTGRPDDERYWPSGQPDACRPPGA